MGSLTRYQEMQGEVVQIGKTNRTNVYYITNNINYVTSSHPPDENHRRTAIITHSDESQSSLKIKKSTQTTEESVLATLDMNSNGVELELGDPLEVDFYLSAANAIYIGAGMSVCVREKKIVKERLYLKTFMKRRMEFKPGVDVFTGSCAASRARRRIGEIFTEGIHIDFVTWCYTGLKRKEACLQEYRYEMSDTILRT